MSYRIRGRLGLVLSMAAAIAAALPSQAQTFYLIYTFTGEGDGGNPLGNLIINGTFLYGTASFGGAYRAGTVFQINTVSKVESMLHAFTGGPDDGAEPVAGLLRDKDGDLFGTTYVGGTHDFGTVFEFPAVGGYKVLHNFAGPTAQGSGPAGALVMDDAGILYGTTYTGGDSTGYGTVYEVMTDGTYETGQSFSPDGALPRAGLYMESGHLYGTTSGGGAHNYGGTIFEVGVRSALYTFSGGPDGSSPLDSPIGDGEGNLYGTASTGGNGHLGKGDGVIFAFDISTGKETVLYTFSGPDGSAPAGSLALDSGGNLYGTTLTGGAYDHGTVFELTAGGTFQTLYNFTGGNDGGHPFAGVTLDSVGNLWGVASQGGDAAAPDGHGTVFEIMLVGKG